MNKKIIQGIQEIKDRATLQTIKFLEHLPRVRKVSEKEIAMLYREEALKHGPDGTSTIQDMRTRELEVKAIRKYVNGSRILEVGCGNGYLAKQIGLDRHFESFAAFDISPEMIAIAKKGYQGRIQFRTRNILSLTEEKEYHSIYTVRCLQNIMTWKNQKKALRNIVRALKLYGEFIMLESFWEGLNILNQARAELGLPRINPPWHNKLFHEYKVIEYLKSLGAEYVGQDCFLSGYYFGSRVLLPALTKNRLVSSNSTLNDYFCSLPPAGDFSPMKILGFRKK